MQGERCTPLSEPGRGSPSLPGQAEGSGDRTVHAPLPRPGPASPGHAAVPVFKCQAQHDCIFPRMQQFNCTLEDTSSPLPPRPCARRWHSPPSPACTHSNFLLQTSQQNHLCCLKFTDVFCYLSSPSPLGSC